MNGLWMVAGDPIPVKQNSGRKVCGYALSNSHRTHKLTIGNVLEHEAETRCHGIRIIINGLVKSFPEVSDMNEFHRGWDPTHDKRHCARHRFPVFPPKWKQKIPKPADWKWFDHCFQTNILAEDSTVITYRFDFLKKKNGDYSFVLPANELPRTRRLMEFILIGAVLFRAGK